MIYFTLSDQPQQVFIPRNGFSPSGALTLTLRSTSGLDVITSTVTEWESVGDFVRFIFEAPAGLIAGEWEFSLAEGSSEPKTLATGLFCVTGTREGAKQYNEAIEYKQYGE